MNDKLCLVTLRNGKTSWGSIGNLELVDTATANGASHQFKVKISELERRMGSGVSSKAAAKGKLYKKSVAANNSKTNNNFLSKAEWKECLRKSKLAKRVREAMQATTRRRQGHKLFLLSQLCAFLASARAGKPGQLG